MSSFFPVSYSTLSAAALADFISEKYLFGKVRCALIVRNVGDTYLVTTLGGMRYVLRVYRPDVRSLSQIRAEMDLLLALKKNGVPVSWPVADRSGEVIQEVEAPEGKRHFVLFTYAEGLSVSRLSEKQLDVLGYRVARFHSVSSQLSLEDARWIFDVETTLVKPLALLEPAYEAAGDPEGFEWMKKAASYASEQLSLLGADRFPAGWCHYDILPKNFHFAGDELTFFDFDFFGYGALVNDIMVFWEHLSLDVFFGRMSQEDADRDYSMFLDGYRRVRSISEEELAAVPYLSLGWWLFYMGFHMTHDQFYVYTQHPQLKLRTNLVRSLMKKYVGFESSDRP